DLLGDGDAVLGDRGRAEGLLEDDVSALGAEGHLDGAGELADAAAHGLAGFLIEGNLFGSHLLLVVVGGWWMVVGEKRSVVGGAVGCLCTNHHPPTTNHLTRRSRPGCRRCA